MEATTYLEYLEVSETNQTGNPPEMEATGAHQKMEPTHTVLYGLVVSTNPTS